MGGGRRRWRPSALGDSARSLARPAALRGAAVEAAWVAAHVAAYPFGVAAERSRPDGRYRLADLPPVQRGLLIGDVEAAGTPILLVHGLVDNRSVFTLLRRHLRHRGFGRIATTNYPAWTGDVRVAARGLGDVVETVCAESGYERIHVVAHSMGGLVARYYVQRLGGDARVHTLVTLGAPHSGTRAARLLPTGVCRQLLPGSDLVRELAEPAPGCLTRFLAFWSDLDVLVSPKESAAIDHPDLTVRNVAVHGVGHTSLPINRGVAREIAATLAQLDPDGGTVSPGISRIGPPDLSEPQRVGAGPGSDSSAGQERGSGSIGRSN